MNHATKTQIKAVVGLGVLAIIASSGCSSRLARENIFANTESAFGLTVAENPQTQLYEVKLGYARHELFYVPSSKLVFYRGAGESLGDEQPPSSISNYNDPSKSPEVLAEIQIGGKSARGQDGNFQLRQRLAIGPKAVTSPAAKAMLANPHAADADALVRELNSKDNLDLRSELDALLAKPLKDNPTEIGDRSFNSTDALAEHLANEISPGSTVLEIRIWGGSNLQELIKKLKDYVESD